MGRGIKLRNYLSKVLVDSEIYIDQEKTKGQNWQETNDKELGEADIILVILTPAALQSQEVLREVRLAQQSKKRIIPCKDDNLDLDWKDIPWKLSNCDGIDFENDEILRTRLYKEINRIKKELNGERSLIIAQQLQFSVDISITHGSMPVIVNNKKFELPYLVKSGSLRFVLAKVDTESISILVDVECEEDSRFEITLPRELIDSRDTNNDEPFFVLIDGQEVSITEKKSSPTDRILDIPIPSDSHQVEIIGKQLLGISYTGVAKSENIVNILFNSHNMHGGKYLEPETLTINVGEKVRWENHDKTSHTITSGGPGDDNTGSQFDSGLFKSGGTFEITFNEKGTYEYCCVIHPWKIGHIIVE